MAHADTADAALRDHSAEAAPCPIASLRALSTRSQASNATSVSLLLESSAAGGTPASAAFCSRGAVRFSALQVSHRSPRARTTSPRSTSSSGAPSTTCWTELLRMPGSRGSRRESSIPSSSRLPADHGAGPIGQTRMAQLHAARESTRGAFRTCWARRGEERRVAASLSTSPSAR